MAIPEEFQRTQWEGFVELTLEDTQKIRAGKYQCFGLLEVRHEWSRDDDIGVEHWRKVVVQFKLGE